MRWTFARFDALTAWQLYDVLRLRSEVFVVEQDCVYLDADGRDAGAHHLLGTKPEGLVAYLRAFPPDEDGEAAIGRVVVHPLARGVGLGRELMERGAACVADRWGPCPIQLSAQAHLEGLYRSLGYQVSGAGYLEDGIPHLPMRRVVT